MRISSLLLLLLWSLPALAFDLEALQARLAATPDIAGRFEQTRYLADLDTELVSRGHFRYERDARVVWTLETPVDKRLVFTPQDAASLDGTADSGANDNDDRRRQQAAELLLSLLDGDWRALEQRFKITLAGDAEAWRVELVPRQQAIRERLKSIHLAGGRYLETLRLQAANDDTLDVAFSDQRPLDAGETTSAESADGE
ncbi:outer membrane lipoprotein carrier protein LolA [Halomonas sp. HP20-15]|uniref:outer membrane lipoprotein carrier protein LolA n=1 Tax=Halomonas sp. HP20-15 TaxID=3085901 RepID=UPI0029815DA7|nr:outer membrane lipoprotein carrier protein LolA [Halomonas sp. HP20-15]MDW5377467.1 outer membrane lipoprotein carrier protein LolA [Halomonas sp. HP20-15]